jgi:hypothetical protein
MQIEFLIFFQKAEAELAYELQAAKTKQRIKEENMQIKVKTVRDILYFLKGLSHKVDFKKFDKNGHWIVMGLNRRF